MRMLPPIVLIVSILTAASSGVPQRGGGRTQEEIGKFVIEKIAAGGFREAEAYFDSSIRPSLTKKAFEGLQASIRSFSDVIGDSLEEFDEGDNVARNYGVVYCREYRFVNEVSKGPPAVLINVSFPDSVSKQVLGVFLKRMGPREDGASATSKRQISTFRGEERTIQGAQTWRIGGQNIEVDEIVLLGLNQRHMLAIKVFDDGAGKLEMDEAKKKAVPIVKHALSEGILKKAQAQDTTVLDRVAVAFLLRDGSGGFRVQIDPSEYR